jgi:hypothetical protein
LKFPFKVTTNPVLIFQGYILGGDLPDLPRSFVRSCKSFTGTPNELGCYGWVKIIEDSRSANNSYWCHRVYIHINLKLAKFLTIMF